MTQWDIFRATGGLDAGSAAATQNLLGIAVQRPDGSVWTVAQRPTLRLGRLDPAASTANYLEWTVPAAGGNTTGAPVGLEVSATGDVWFTTGGSPELAVKAAGANTFRHYRFPFAGAAPHRFALTPDGAAAFVPVKAGTNTAIYRVPRAAAGATAVVAQRWRFPSSSDDPRFLAIDSAGMLWFTNRNRSTLARLDTSLSTNNLTQWPLPSAETVKSAAGLSVVNGAAGAATVCVVMENVPGQPAGEAMCLDVATNTFRSFARPVGAGLEFPQQVTVSAAGELFVTEQYGNALSVIGPQAAATLQVVLPLTGSSNTRLAKGTDVTVTVTETVAAAPASLTVTPTAVPLAGAEDVSGHVRYAFAAFAPLNDPATGLPTVPRERRPVGLTPLVAEAGPGTGTLYIAEYFDGPSPIERRMGAVISRFALGAAPPDALLVTPSALTFEATAGGAAPPAQVISVEEQHGRPLSWSAAASQPWLTLTPSSSTTPGSLSVTVDAAGLAPSATAYAATVTIDDGAGGADAIAVPVSLTVVARPTMEVTPPSLEFVAVNTDTTPPAAKTFAISSTGGGTLEWVAEVDIPGVEAELEVAGQPFASRVTGSGPATVTLHIRSVPGTVGLRRGAVTITSTNALNPSASVAVQYDVRAVAQPLIVDRGALTFTMAPGGALPPAQTITLTNTGGTPITWGVVSPYTEAVQPAWVTVSPQVAELQAGASMAVSVALNAAATGADALTGVITIDDHTGNSPPATIGVTLARTAPTIVFSTDTLAFTREQGGGAAPSQTFALTNSGDAPLAVVPQVFVNNGNGWLTVSPTDATTLTPGGSLTFTAAVDAGALAPGTYTAQLTVADPLSTNGSDTVFITFTVTVPEVRDTTPPEITVPGPLTFEATGASGVAVSYTATASDLVDGAVAATCTPPSGAVFALGVTGVACSATDAAGNTGTRTFTVTVRDTTAPALTVPAPMTMAAPGVSGTAVSFTATASDLVSGALPVVCTPASGSVFPVGTTTVTCSASDAAGNVASGAFAVTVTPPALQLTLGASSLTFRTGRLAYCNGVAVGPNWKDQGLVITNSGGGALTFAATTATSWIRVGPAAGTLAVGASATLVVSVDLSGLGRGIYHGAVTVSADGTSTVVPVTLEIGNALPTLCLTPKQTGFGTVKASKTSTLKYFDILNVGDEPLGSWTAARRARSRSARRAAPARRRCRYRSRRARRRAPRPVP